VFLNIFLLLKDRNDNIKMEVDAKSLEIVRIANCDVFVGAGIPTSWKRLFGGQTLSQSLMAAAETVPDNFMVHSIHAYFILAGDCDKQILFDVERIRDGNSFKTRAVKALQDSRAIFHLTASFHRPEYGVEYQKPFERLSTRKFAVIPAPETFFSKSGDDESKTIVRYTITEGRDWKLCYVRVPSKVNGWQMNCSMLAFLSDQGMVGMVRQPHVDVQWSMSVSLDHSIHFHRPEKVHVDEWMIFYTSTLISSGGRGTASTLVYNLEVSC